MPPPGVPCPICGRMFGRSSIDIHIPQCQSKTIQQWRNDPATRDRPLPAGLAQSLSGGFSSQQQQRRGASSSTSSSRLPGPSSLSSKLMAGGVGNSFGNENQRVGGGGRTTNAMMMGGGAQQPLNLVGCRYCGRNFSSDRIGKHESVCIGSQKARQTFDTKSQRLKELMDDMNPRFAPRRKVGGATTTTRQQPQQSSSRSYNSPSSMYNPNKKDWRSEHLEFQQMIREAKRDARASQPSSYGVASSSTTRYNSRTTTTTSGRNPTNTRTSSSTAYRGSQPVSTNSRAPHGAGFVARQPARRAPSSGAGGFGNTNNSRFSGIRDLSSGPSSSPGGGAPKQISILPTNDTSAGMWSALGRDQPTYGSYGQIGTRGGGGARARAQQQNQSAGFW